MNRVLNGAFSGLLAKDVDFSGGDEVQGLFYDSLGAYLYYRLQEIFLLPHRIRGGIGTGTWDVKMPSKGSAAQDGPAYHLARKAIEQSRSSKTQCLCILTPGAADIDLNLLANASASLRAGLSAGQLNALRIMEILYPLNFQGMIHTPRLAGLWEYGGHNGSPAVADIELALPGDTAPEEKTAVRNMVSSLAGCTGTTVQNISNLMQKGNLLAIRSIDYHVACRLLERKDERGA
jgi:hypothetical protein